MFLRARTAHTLLSLGSPFHVAGVAGRCCCRSGSTYVTRLHNVEIYSKVPKFVPGSCLIFKNRWTWSLWVHYYSFLFYLWRNHPLFLTFTYLITSKPKRMISSNFVAFSENLIFTYDLPYEICIVLLPFRNEVQAILSHSVINFLNHKLLSKFDIYSSILNGYF